MTVRLLIATTAALCLCACGGAQAAVDGGGLGVATSPASPSPLASGEVATSPDGGIYRNPDALSVVLVARVDPGPFEARLGGAGGDWAPLHPLGRFTVIGVRLRNDGKAASQPQLDDLQVASDQAPAGTGKGPLRHFYHPTYPLAVVSDVALAGDCTVALDPGQAATVLLLYPPLQDAPRYVWGRYGDFAFSLPVGGSAGSLPTALHGMTCTPPVPQATP